MGKLLLVIFAILSGLAMCFIKTPVRRGGRRNTLQDIVVTRDDFACKKKILSINTSVGSVMPSLPEQCKGRK